jgi:hypothetical protein
MLLFGQTSTNSQQRRRAQNRASQRAYRERRGRHVKSLEERLENMASQHEFLFKEYAQLCAEHERVLEDAAQWKADLTEVKENQPSQSIILNRGGDGEKPLFVKVMICKKQCRNREFPEGA